MAQIAVRAFRKRVAALAPVDEPEFNKKRVVFADLPNSLEPLVSDPVPDSEIEKTIEKQNSKAKVTKSKGLTKAKNKDANWDDPQMCGPYAENIYDYLRRMEVELKRRALPNYIEEIQEDVTGNMRGVLVDWLVEVADEYKLLPETLFLAVNYIDRFLSVNVLNRQKLQLLGVSSMLIASKYEEITPPEVDDFVYITDNTFPAEDVVKMESNILNSLKFELGNPTVKTFLRRFTTLAQEEYKGSKLRVEFLGCYFAELSLLDYSCVKFLPSLVAASAIFLAKFIVRPKTNPWTLTLQENTRYQAADLKECVLILHDLFLGKRGAALEATRNKYKQPKLKCVSIIPSPPEIPMSYFGGQQM